MFPWFGAPHRPPFPIFPPEKPSCPHDCCQAPNAKLGNLIVQNKGYLFGVRADGYTWDALDNAQYGGYSLQIEMGQKGYKYYQDNKACGEGAKTAPAYITFDKGENGQTRSYASLRPASKGLSIPVLGAKSGSKIDVRGIYGGGTITFINPLSFTKDAQFIAVTIKAGKSLTWDEAIDLAVDYAGLNWVAFEGGNRIRLKGETVENELLTVGTYDNSMRSHLTIVGAG